MKKLTPEVIAELKWYVYTYSDPFTNDIFYVGKGKGERCFAHLKDKSGSPKVKKIEAIRKKGKEPLIEIIRYGLSDREAKLAEASLIDGFGIENLTNKFRGEHSRTFGRENIEEILLRSSAKEVEIKHEAVLFNLTRSFDSSQVSEELLYEFTKGSWRIGVNREKAKYAFAVYQGIVREVYEIAKWQKSRRSSYKERDNFDEKSFNCRWEFVGSPAKKEVRDKYIGKAVRKHFRKFVQSPFLYVNC